ncbi:MAG: C-GCAxxG-C-C family (seleno)protein [Candidatus Omnitrophota bacterium]
MAIKASDYFHGTDGYNCAQAVLKAFQQEYSIAEETIAEYTKFGGGRADNGLCGALFALHHIIEAPDQITSANAYFEKTAGSIKCREIKKFNKLSCKECVDLSANILNQVKST